MATSQILRHLYSLKPSSPDFSRYLHSLIQSDGEENYLSGLQGSELTELVDFLDEALGSIPVTDDVFRQCLHRLQAICSHQGILPSSHIISGDIARLGDYPVASGGFADVWEGTHGDIKVCIKYPRITIKNRQEVEKAFYKEAIVWKTLRHQNIVPFIGVTQNPLQFVSEWMPNGTLTEYLSKDPSASRIALLLDIAEGLAYLHAKRATHGDLKGPNVLIDQSGRARLSDFGFASIVRGLDSVLVTKVQGFSPRWAAPEVISKGDRNTREADVYAFGMVVIEVFTGRCPFNELTDPVAVSKIIRHELPDRPQQPGLTDKVWDTTLCCWQQDPVRRPKMKRVVVTLRECYRLSIPTPERSTNSESNGSTRNPMPISPVRTVQKPLEPSLRFGAVSTKSSDANSARSLGTSRRSGGPTSQDHEDSADLISIPSPSPDPSWSSAGLPSESLSDSSRTYSGPQNPHVATPHTGQQNLTASSFEDACRRIDEIAEELAIGKHKSREGSIVELLKLCGDWRTVPTSYKLGSVVKEAQHRVSITSPGAVIWKGKYKEEEVALKNPRVPSVISSFCKDAVLIKQLKHHNIIPLHGVSTDLDFGCCLVFPWYNNGDVMAYLERNPDVDRYNLLLGAMSGLQFLHDNCVVHGGLRPSHVLIDDNGNPRLATGCYSSIVAVPGTPFASHLQPVIGRNLGDFRYLAPEILSPKDHGMDDILLTKESDIYGMAKVIYQVLAGVAPYTHNEVDAVLKAKAGTLIPKRPSSGFDDLVWNILERCWNRDPTKRPPLVELDNALSNHSGHPGITDTPQEQATEELPRTLYLQCLGVTFSPGRSTQEWLYVTLKYGSGNVKCNSSHTRITAPSGENTWEKVVVWRIGSDKEVRRQLVSLELLIKRDSSVEFELYATGSSYLFNNDNVGKEFFVKLEAQDAAGSAVIRFRL